MRRVQARASLALLLMLPVPAAEAATGCVVRAPRDGWLVQAYRYDAGAHPGARFDPAEVYADLAEVHPGSTGDGYLNAGAMLLGRWTVLAMQDVQPRGIYSSSATDPAEVTLPAGGFIPGAGEPDRYPFQPYSYDPYSTGTELLIVWFHVGGRGPAPAPILNGEITWDFRIPGGCEPITTTSVAMHLDHRSFAGRQTMTPVAGVSDWLDHVQLRTDDLVIGAVQHGTFTDPRHALRTGDTCTDRFFFDTPSMWGPSEERSGIGAFIDGGGEYAFRYWYRCLTPNLNMSLIGIDFL